ncbi:hypothetical protein D6D54_06990 [Spiroplasma poulsonii]|uniref:Uncharacterized protein n=1 Tax=Spiroplasma poulsonii TaxID=2138 RepID=A0A433EP83_9MOLU|nr:hypothetical protein [Spiroplasma poulsonii]MBW3059238.1 hypothetical protein [Spiroplasma poulsonii]RUP76151.1 hypothetical protein D6D54_06990 [Spiroplasma poulsonii]
MKKLLSLLSVLTISGSAVPTTIAASPYKKEETLNSHINYQHTNNNLESLNRSKRDSELKDDRLWRDFNYDLDKSRVNLGLIDDVKWGNLWTALSVKLQERYTNLNGLKFTAIGVTDKISLSSISEGYYIKIYVKRDQNYYTSNLNPKTKFYFNTQSNINRISNQFSNDPKVKQWISHITDFNNKFNRQLKENFNNKTFQDKKEWIEDKLEFFKSYMRDWSYIENLIEHDLKFQTLDYLIQGISEDVNNLKLKVSEINNKINSIEQSLKYTNNISNYNDSINTGATACAGTTGIIAAGSALIPGIGTLVSLIFGVISATCSLVPLVA